MTLEEAMAKQIELQKELDNIKAINTALETKANDSSSKLGEAEKTIGELRESNMNLFLKVTSQVDPTPTPTITPPAPPTVKDWDTFMSEY